MTLQDKYYTLLEQKNMYEKFIIELIKFNRGGDKNKVRSMLYEAEREMKRKGIMGQAKNQYSKPVVSLPATSGNSNQQIKMSI